MGYVIFVVVFSIVAVLYARRLFTRLHYQQLERLARERVEMARRLADQKVIDRMWRRMVGPEEHERLKKIYERVW